MKRAKRIRMLYVLDLMQLQFKIFQQFEMCNQFGLLKFI